MGGALSYGEHNFGISNDKQTDINQLQGEVDQIKSIMNRLRASGDSALSMQPGHNNTVDDQRSSLLSILSKVK